MVAEIDALILEVEKFRSSNSAEPVRQKVLQTYVPAWQAVNSIAGGLPAGGTTGQALVKASNTNYDTTWATVTTTPGAPVNSVQFNDAGAFGGSAFLTFNKTSGHLADGSNSTIDTINNPNHFSETAYITLSSQDNLSDDLSTYASDFFGIGSFNTYNATQAGFSSGFVYGIAGITDIVAGSIGKFFGIAEFAAFPRNSGSGDVGEFYGAQLGPSHRGGKITTTFTGLFSNPSIVGATGTIAEFAGVLVSQLNTGVGAVTNSYGVYVKSPTDGTAAIVNQYGLKIDDQSTVGSALSYNIFSTGATAKNKLEGILEVGGKSAFGSLATIVYTTSFMASNDLSVDFQFGPMFGVQLTPALTDTGAVGGTDMNGIYTSLTVTSNNPIPNTTGVNIKLYNFNAGVRTNIFSEKIQSPSLFFGATATNVYGLYIEDHSGLGVTLNYNIFSAGTGKNHFHGGVEVATAAQLIRSTVALTDGAGVGAGTIATAPHAGNPDKWLPIVDNGVTGWVPWWHA